jgi:hypothetical protein
MGGKTSVICHKWNITRKIHRVNFLKVGSCTAEIPLVRHQLTSAHLEAAEENWRPETCLPTGKRFRTGTPSGLHSVGRVEGGCGWSRQHLMEAGDGACPAAPSGPCMDGT